MLRLAGPSIVVLASALGACSTSKGAEVGSAPTGGAGAATSMGGTDGSTVSGGSNSIAGKVGGGDGGASGSAGAGPSLPITCAPVSAPSTAFVHPGGLHSRSNLERMRYQVAAEQQPWHTSFQRLASDARASADYDVRGDASWTSVQRGGTHGAELESDANAAYLNALMWAITEDEAHAQKCVEIFNTWKNLTTFVPGGTPALDAGLFAYKMVEAAEIIKSTYDGWAAADVLAFQNMLVHPGYSSSTVPTTLSDENGTFYWRIYNGDSGRHGNQDMIAWRAMLVMGVFLDNRTMFERALRYFKGEPHLEGDLPYPAGPSSSGAQLADNPYFTTFERRALETTPDFGYNGVLSHYVWENGQLQESSRDQQHAFFGIGIAAGIAEVAWNQGDAVWNALDQRLLKGFEFTARYNASYLQAFPDQPTPWEPSEDELVVRTDRTGRWLSKAVNPYFENDFERLSRGDFPGKRPVFEQALAHFQVRMGLPESEARWTQRARDVALERYGQEPNGFSLDHPGWGGLTFHRPAECAGDPVSGFEEGKPVMATPSVPAPILAVNYDFFPACGEGHTYHDASPGNDGGQYRADDVDLGCSAESEPVVVGVEAGEWLTYTLRVPRAGRHSIELTYAADGETALRFRIDGQDATEVLTLPETGLATTTQQLTTGVDLRAGVQAVRLVVTAAAAGLQLHSFRLVPE